MKRPNGMRPGVSALELLVVLAVIGLLLTLLLPAIWSARNAARTAQCQSRLKSIGLACQAYVAAFDFFPISYYDGGPLVRLVPFLESDDVFERMNYVKSGPGYASTGTLVPRAPIYLPAVICPADVGGDMEPRANYAGTNSDGSWDRMNGLFQWKPVRPGDITDGQSHTAAFSEWLTSPHLRYVANQRAASYERRSVAIRLPKSKPPTREAFIQECLAISFESRPSFSALGLKWTHFGHGDGVYNHQLTPNTRSCEAEYLTSDKNAYTAASFHSGGVNVCMADGSVQWAGDSIDLAVWRAMATIAGGETSST